MPGATPGDVERLCKETREDGVVYRLKVPLPPPVSARPDAVRPWARAIFEKESFAAAKKRWPTLKQELVMASLKPARVRYLLETYGFDALNQFE
jgi:hypothetical protein